MSLEAKETKKFISVLGSTGDFRMSVPEGTEGAIKREYETSDGKKGEKYELAYKSIGGKIVDVEFFEGDYGKNLLLTFDFEDNTEHVVLSLGCNTPFGEDVLKKLPNIDFNAWVVMTPYNFDDDNGKNRKGISITQGDEKVTNAYYDGKKSLLDYPEPEGDTSKYDADDWKMYFTKARKHTIQYAEKEIVPQFGHVVEATNDEDDF